MVSFAVTLLIVIAVLFGVAAIAIPITAAVRAQHRDERGRSGK
ncbi:hypothetical protein [Actinomadura algeriensis]|uniref:Uncharacterized protein n=1 Tax=Actinomadura algeriensis TaxID=1679523 RepID=A0ABR9JU13_9ACTN|nr:hypothetical protein [Actinomadura algeriensis]MBE1534050.1 hypothetical protein [Actinomadura algeriensis]